MIASISYLHVINISYMSSSMDKTLQFSSNHLETGGNSVFDSITFVLTSNLLKN